MAFTKLLLVAIALLIAPASASQAYVNCEMVTLSGVNIMTTTTDTIMAVTPTDDDTIATADVTTVGAGGTVTLTFGPGFGRGVVQASSGTFTAPEFAGPDGGACTAPVTGKWKGVAGATSPITWTAPATPGQVVINVVGTTDRGQPIGRKVIIVAVSAAAATVGGAGGVTTGVATGAATGFSPGAGTYTATGASGGGFAGTGGQQRGYGMVGSSSTLFVSLTILGMCTLVSF